MPSSFLHTTRWPADCLCLVYFLADLLSQWESSRGLSWDEAWLYQTTITLHLHSICTLLFSSHREGACVPGCLCSLCYRVLLLSVRARRWENANVGEEEEERWEKERERKERPYDTAITPHAGSICTLLFVSLLEKSRWFTKPEEAADPFSLGTVLCVFVCVCMCLQMRAAHPFRRP